MSSHLWQHFENLDGKLTRCKYCSVVYNTKNTTSGLRYHLTSKHADRIPQHFPSSSTTQQRQSALEDSENDDEESTVRAEGSSAEKESEVQPAKRARTSVYSYRARKCTREEIITNAYIKMIAKEMLPLSFGEGPGVQEFMKTAIPDWKIPSRSAVTHRVRKMYEGIKHQIIENLKKFTSVTLTTDAWSSRTATSFVTVTLHAIDENWCLRSFTLDTLEVSERHTGENLREHLLRVLTDWNISDKVVAIVHDNASNIISAMRSSLQLGESVCCFSHTLQCVLNKTLERHVLKEFIQKLSSIVAHFKHSNLSAKALKCAQHKLNLPQHRLINRCNTRWNSTFAMGERLVEQRQAIVAVLNDLEWTSRAISAKLLMADDEWHYLEEIVNVLRPFNVATEVMSTESQSTIAMIRPLVFSFIAKFLVVKRTDSEPIQKMKKRIATDLQERFLKEDTVNIAALSCILDPRYKDLVNESDEYRRKIQDRLTDIMAEEGHAIQVQSNPTAKDQGAQKLEYLFDDESHLSQQFERSMSLLEQQNITELENYLRQPTLPRTDDPLLWWNSQRRKFPTISRIAKKYLGIPASSTPSERVFSSAGNIISAKRSALLPENANNLIFLYQNRDLINDE